MVEKRPRTRTARQVASKFSTGPVTVERILAASARLFAERGYYNTSMEDIASVVGILKGSLYHHIPSKELILDRILEQMALDLVSRTEDVAKQQLSAEQRFDSMVRILVQNVGQWREANAIYATEHSRLPTAIRRKYRKLLARHRELFEGLVVQALEARGPQRVEVDVSLAVTSIISQASMVSLWYRPGGRLTLSEIEDEFVRQAQRIVGICG